jgi:dTDP-glucose 4,6-dehydratase
MNILVTGGCGFIGSHFIEEFIDRSDVDNIVNVDCMTYAANKNLPFESNPKYHHYEFDIAKDSILPLLKSYNVDHIVHFAAESHVDNSIENSGPFIQTNIVGTHKILTDLLEWKKDKNFRFVHVSTDEVYGTLNSKEAAFNVDSPYRPNSPYAASKAASDLLVRSYVRTYKLPAMITNCSNNFGPRQFPEKMIPLCIDRLKNRQPIPLYGTGQNVRDWIYVKDHVRALWTVMREGVIGKQYLIGGDNEITNFELIHCLRDTYRLATGVDPEQWEWFKYVEDRKGHDLRYAIDTADYKLEFSKLELTDFNQALSETVKSYL